MTDEQYVVDFVSKFGSYEQGVEALVKAHARLADQFDRTSRAGDRVEKQMLGLAGVERSTAQSAETLVNAQIRLQRAMDAQNVARVTRDLGAQAGAEARLASAIDDVSRAQNRLRSAGNQTQRIAATNDLATATGRLTVAETALARSSQTATTSSDGLANASPRLRYALYDVSSTATIAGAALLAMSVATASVAINFQREFADVARTTDATGVALEQLREDFNELYRTIPISFDDLTDIGTLAGQLDIADASLASFTETVAKFSATTGVSVEDSATAIGRLAQLLPDVGDDYEGLADSILKVGTNSVSTEAQIIAIASQLAGVATTANLSSQELIALSGTLASLGTAPELSRGVITRLFSNIEVAIASGGERLQDFATVSGRTAEEFASDWSTDSFAVIQDLFSGIGSSGSDMGSVLRDLGITASRDIPVFQKLAQNTDLLASAFDDASSAAGEVDRQYSIISSTVAEKLTVLINNFNSLLDTLGQSTLGFGFLIDAGIGLLQILERIAENPVASTLGTLAIVAGVLGGAFLLFVGVATRAAASALAFRLAVQEMGLSSSTSALSLNTLTAAALGTGAGASRAAIGVRALSTAMKALSVIGIVSIAGEAAESFYEWYDRVRGLRAETDELAKSLAALTPEGGAGDLSELFGTGEATTRNAFASLADEGIVGDVASLVADLQAAFGPLQEIGTLGTADTGLARIRDNLVQVDEALATLVTSGNVDQAKIAFDALAQTEAAQGATTEQILSLLPSYAAALDGVGSSASAASDDGSDLVTEMQDMISAFTDVQQTALNTQNSISSLGESLGQNGTSFDQFSEAGRANMTALLDTINAVAEETPGDAAATAANLQALFDSLVNGAGVSANSLYFLKQIIAGLTSQAGGEVATATISYEGLFSGISSGATKAASSTASATKEVRTLLDYASDLAQVTDRAFEIRFGSQSALDEVTTSWMDLNEEIAEYQRKVQELTADRAIQEYYLSVAEAYEDTLRAGELRSNIADIDAELAEATANASTELTGNSKAATVNRKRITDLVASYGDYIEALAAGGADQATLNAAVAQSRAEFLAQAQALGYSNAELQPYIASFNDMATAIAQVPRNITVAANVNPALQALNELEARARSVAGANYGGITIPVKTNNASLIASLTAQINAAIANMNRGGYSTAAANYIAQLSVARQQAIQAGYATGGYVGNGGKYEPKGVVHGGEFVFTKQATSNAGTGNLYAMMRAMETGRGYAMGGYVPTTPVAATGGGMMGLSPQDRGILRGILDAVKTIEPGYLPDEMVSRASQRGDKVRQARGEIG